MARKCNCAGVCGTEAEGLSRRDFLTKVGAGTTVAFLTGPAWTAWTQQLVPPEELALWKRGLLQPDAPRLYRSQVHTDARLHLGGIGTGNFEIGADGQFTTWQLFNTLRDGQVAFFLAVKAGETARLLQTTGGPGWPTIERIEMTGEYPFATLKFYDAQLPVELELSAFSPFAPLDTALSSMPLAVLGFRIHNRSASDQTVSLAAFMQNMLGYDAVGKTTGVAHPNFGGNSNHPFLEEGLAGLEFRVAPGREPTLDQPVSLFASANLRGLRTPPQDRPQALSVEILDGGSVSAAKLRDPAHTIVWIEEAPEDLPEPLLKAARDAVEAGASLVFAGRRQPLLEAYARITAGQPLADATPRSDILFEDFESGYGKWKISGDAFGERPAASTLPNQQAVSGFLGKGLVNTYLRGDDTTGRLVSGPFKVERNFIRFLIGGGAHAHTQIRLLVEDRVVRSAAGRDNERLMPGSWEVRDLQGQTARLAIVDEQKGPWGHINVDQIEFSDVPASLGTMRMLDALLPARFTNIRPRTANDASDPTVLEFENLRLHADATEAKASSGLVWYTRPLGKGKVVMAAGPILEPAFAEVFGARQRAFQVLCSLVGAQYAAPDSVPAKAPGFGTMALATLGPNPTVQAAFESWQDAWKTFAADGGFVPVGQASPNPPTGAGRTMNGAVGTTVLVPAGKTVEVPFVVAWHYPNKYNGKGVWMGCHYATLWPDARAVVRSVARGIEPVREKTELFRRTFYDSTLPYWLLDCLTSQAAIIRHIGVVFRIANGDAYGWEGSNGCCQPTCTHVWGYEQSLARLFPELEKDMRRIDFKHQQRPDGGVNNRTDVPSPAHPTGEQPFADGHASCILKAYREALNHPDDSWLKEYWPAIKRGVEYLVKRDATGNRGEPEGTLKDDQWNTYDEALHGVTTFISGYYLAALRAGEEWARRVGEPDTADRFHAIFEKGQKRLIDLCWNGEYFEQHLPDYLLRSGEVGPGCMSDQLIGQWWAHQLGLGYLFPADKVRSALRAIFKYNWVPDLTNWKHSPRAFAGAKDKGLLICTWPKGGRTGTVMLYSDEVWTGIEYQVAAHMICEGMIEEGLAITKGARDRYDGVPRAPIPRNPWNEIECGGHYARAMSSWSLLLALSGYRYDGPAQTLDFVPQLKSDRFKSFFCGPEGWGSLTSERQAGRQMSVIDAVAGQLLVTQLRVAAAGPVQTVAARLGSTAITAKFEAESEGSVRVILTPGVAIKPGASLSISVS